MLGQHLYFSNYKEKWPQSVVDYYPPEKCSMLDRFMSTTRRLSVPLVILILFILTVAAYGGGLQQVLFILGATQMPMFVRFSLAVLLLHGTRKTLFPYIDLEALIHGSENLDRVAMASVFGVFAWYILGLFILMSFGGGVQPL